MPQKWGSEADPQLVAELEVGGRRCSSGSLLHIWSRGLDLHRGTKQGEVGTQPKLIADKVSGFLHHLQSPLNLKLDNFSVS